MWTFVKPLAHRWLCSSIAFSMLVLVAWCGGPYLSIGGTKPFETVEQRLLAMVWLAVLFILAEVLQQFRVRHANTQLALGITSRLTPEASQPSNDATQLQARFDEAIAALRTSKGNASNLCEVPWYIIIGPPGAGKTTLIANSGLHFPLARKFGSQALRGVGGTRNCDWWFTEAAVLLDTAGRYTTQDSDPHADRAEWMQFLELLRKHRSRQPINGVLIALSAPELLSLSDAQRERHVHAVRARLDELARVLKIELPAYLLLTKLDLISGFTEFFDDLNQQQRTQVWGVTFPLDVSRTAEGSAALPTEFDLLLERLNARLLGRMESERDVWRRIVLFTFPRQFAALRRNLVEFVTAAFSARAATHQLQLRGVYFTSGTQEGTPIDRMIAALARTFGLDMRVVPLPRAQGRAYFIQRLLQEVLFKESGLAGMSSQTRRWRAVFSIGAYVTVAIVLIVGLAGFTVSYHNNRNYLAALTPPIEQLELLNRESDSNQPLTASLQRLDAFARATKVAEQYRSEVPWSLRWGLYQGRSLGNAARDAYLRELNAALLPAIAEHFRERVRSMANEPDKLYEYLKAYLMLGQPQHRDPNQLLYIGGMEWQRVFANDPVTLERFNVHFNALIADADHMQPARLDADTVERARISLAQAPLPALMYGRLKLGYVDDRRAVNLAAALGAGAVLVRRSGASLNEPFPALYSRQVFAEISSIGKVELVRQLVSENWVMGSNFVDRGDAPLLMGRLMQFYEADYIRAWDELLADLRVQVSSDPLRAAEQWGQLAGSASPLLQLLELVRTHTALVENRQSLMRVPRTPGRALALANGADAWPAGEAITRHFEVWRTLLAGTPPRIEMTLQKFAAIQRALNQLNAYGEPVNAEAANQVNAAVQDLEQHARSLPATLGKLLLPTLASNTVSRTSYNLESMLDDCWQMRGIAMGERRAGNGGEILRLASRSCRS